MYNNRFKTKPHIGAQLIPSHPLANGLILSYLFNEKGIVSSPIYDKSLNNRNTTLYNGAFVAEGAQHTANNQAIAYLADASWQSPSKMTVVVKMKRVGSWVNYDSLLAKIDSGTWAKGYWLYWYSNQIRFAFGGYTKYAYAAYTATDTFTQFVGVYDGTNARIFIDGVEETPFATTQVISNDALAIGAFGLFTYPAYGVYEYVYMYNRVLTLAEILSLKENPYQMFQQVKNPVFYSFVSAGGGVLPTTFLTMVD